MGRLKVLFRALCLKRNRDLVASDHSFTQEIDVSHLATPHITSTTSLPLRSSAGSTPVGESAHDENCQPLQTPAQAALISSQQPPRTPDRESTQARVCAISLPIHSQGNSLSHPSPSTPSSQNSEHHEPQVLIHTARDRNQPQQQPQPVHQNNGPPIPLVRQQQIPNDGLESPDRGNPTNKPKLSYDIISVREPLHKVLAERQQAQQNQRQILSDHEYIEVYGERGSSCFYEEIAGSTTSSTTYDQIGAASNHNYQVLIHAYAVANLQNGLREGEPQNHRASSLSNQRGDSPDVEDIYDATHSTDQPDGQAANHCPKPPKLFVTQPSVPNPVDRGSPKPPLPTDRTSIPSQSIPVYSVINRAARRNNLIIKATVDSCRPPQPPPKNLPMSPQPSTSAMPPPKYNTQGARNASPMKSTSSYRYDVAEVTDCNPRFPRPPPRLSKSLMFNTTNRPLPSPEGPKDFSEDTLLDRAMTCDDDIESVNNGYELLRSNFDDDQMDVGYEKIRESNRYSGGSLSSQFCPLQALDNGGYESVQPIYSSPSNILSEPNYEAIGPPTASELAAAATARLSAVEAAIESSSRRDQ